MNTQKLYPTSKGLDDWMAQLYGLDLNDMPSCKPKHMSSDAFDRLKKYIKKVKRAEPFATSDLFQNYKKR